MLADWHRLMMSISPTSPDQDGTCARGSDTPRVASLKEQNQMDVYILQIDDGDADPRGFYLIGLFDEYEAAGEWVRPSH